MAPTTDPLAASANGRDLAYNNATGVIYYGFATTSGGLADDGKISETNAAGQDLRVLFKHRARWDPDPHVRWNSSVGDVRETNTPP